MKKLTRLYHVTPAANLLSIAEEGLRPQLGPRSVEAGELEARVYFFPSLEAVEQALLNWLGELFDEDEPLALLAAGCEVADPQHFECLATQVIAPQALKVLSEDIGTEVALGRFENEEGDPIARYVERIFSR